MNVPKPTSALLAREPRVPWRPLEVLPVGAEAGVIPGVLYLFGIGPVPRPGGLRKLLFGWRDGKLEPLERLPEEASLASAGVVLGPGLDGPGTALPAQVREARALAALDLAWRPALREDIPPDLVQRILRVSAELHASAPWDRSATSLAVDCDGKHTWDVILGRFPCGCAGIHVFPAGALDRARRTNPRTRDRVMAEQEMIALSIGDEPAYAVAPLRDDGWPVVPALAATRGGRQRRLDELDVARLETVARVIVDGESWIPCGDGH